MADLDGLTVSEALKVMDDEAVDDAAGEIPVRRSAAPQIETEEDLSEDEERVADVRETLRIDASVDPLAALLDSTKRVYDYVPIPRLGAQFQVRAIEDEQAYRSLVERCTEVKRSRRGQSREKINGPRLTKLIVAYYTVDPAFAPSSDAEVQARYEKLVAQSGVREPEDLVSKWLLIGEVEKLGDAIMTLSGFDDGDLLVEAAGN